MVNNEDAKIEHSSNSLNNRVDIFHHLVIHPDTRDLEEALFDGILTDGYEQFVAFCNEILQQSPIPCMIISCKICETGIQFNSTTA